MKKAPLRVMRIVLEEQSVRVSVGDLLPGENRLFEEYARTTCWQDGDPGAKDRTVIDAVNWGTRYSARPVRYILLRKDEAEEVTRILRECGSLQCIDEDGYLPELALEDPGTVIDRADEDFAPCEEKTKVAPLLARELLKGYRKELEKFDLRKYPADGDALAYHAERQAMRILGLMRKREICEQVTFCRMAGNTWIMKASASREAVNRICSAELSVFSHEDLNGAVDFFRGHPEWALTDVQKDRLRDLFMTLGRKALYHRKKAKEPGGKETMETLGLRDMVTVAPGEKAVPDSADSPLVKLNRLLGLMREMEVYCCVTNTSVGGKCKSGTAFTEYGIFSVKGGLRKQVQFVPWVQVLAEGLIRQSGEFDLWSEQTRIRLQDSGEVSAYIPSWCGKIYCLLDEFLKSLEKDGFGQ